MSIPQKVKKYLDKQEVDYQELAHKTVYTTFDAAQTLKKELKQIAKNLLVQADKTFALVVVPADKKIDLGKIKKALGAKQVSIPSEKVMIKVLKIKPGAISSFGKLHKLELLVDKAMLNVKQAVFSTGSYTDSVFMKVKDYLQMEEAKLADVAMKGGYTIPKGTKKKMLKVKQAVAAKKKTSPKKTVKKKTVKKKVTQRKTAKKKSTKRKK